MSTPNDDLPAAGGRRSHPALARVLSFRNLAALSTLHSIVFAALLVCAFALGNPEPATFVFGLSHGILYPVMAVACGVAARLGTVSMTTALVVIVLGAAGPFFGTFEFLRGSRARGEAAEPAPSRSILPP